MKNFLKLFNILLLSSICSLALANVAVDGSDLSDQSVAQSDSTSTAAPDSNATTADNAGNDLNVGNNTAANNNADNNTDVDDVYADNSKPASASKENTVSQNMAMSDGSSTNAIDNTDNAAAIDHVIPAGSVQDKQTAMTDNMPASRSSAFKNGNSHYTHPAIREVAPIVDPSSMSTEQRLARVEAALSALQNDHVLEQVSSMQQQVQALQGQVDVIQHQQTAMQTEQRTVYQDLDQRISKAQSVATNSSVAAGTNTAAVKPQVSAKTVTTAAGDAQTNTPIGQEKVSVKEQDAYQNAFNNIKEKKYPEGITAMESYLKTYPDGRYALNAEYWLGELYLLNGDENTASDHFNKVIAKDPHAPKAADAMLKLGMIAADSNQPGVAKQRYQKVIDQYPTSNSARVAEQNLKKINQDVA